MLLNHIKANHATAREPWVLRGQKWCSKFMRSYPHLWREASWFSRRSMKAAHSWQGQWGYVRQWKYMDYGYCERKSWDANKHSQDIGKPLGKSKQTQWHSNFKLCISRSCKPDWCMAWVHWQIWHYMQWSQNFEDLLYLTLNGHQLGPILPPKKATPWIALWLPNKQLEFAGLSDWWAEEWVPSRRDMSNAASFTVHLLAAARSKCPRHAERPHSKGVQVLVGHCSPGHCCFHS